MDDDDYYPPERVSHAVEMLQSHPKALCAGASVLHTYFKEIDKIENSLMIKFNDEIKNNVELQNNYHKINDFYIIIFSKINIISIPICS